jgi:hypothetical protein
MDSQTLLLNLGLGFLLGMAGQVVRAVAGLRKHSGTPPSSGAGAELTPREAFNGTQFAVSLLLGGVAGMLAVVVLWDKMNNLNKDTALGLLAAGYAGSDFLEGVIKWMPKPPGQS